MQKGINVKTNMDLLFPLGVPCSSAALLPLFLIRRRPILNIVFCVGGSVIIRSSAYVEQVQVYRDEGNWLFLHHRIL